MAATPSTITYKSGYTSTVSDGTTTWPQAKNIVMPDVQGGFVEEVALDGIDVFPEGITDFGNISFEIPQDGSANMISATEKTWTIAGSGAVSSMHALGHCIGDSGGTLTRGSPAIRRITVSLHEALHT